MCLDEGIIEFSRRILRLALISVVDFLLQKVLSLDGSTCDEALKLFTETKRILSASMSNIGSGTVKYIFFSLTSQYQLNVWFTMTKVLFCSSY